MKRISDQITQEATTNLSREANMDNVLNSLLTTSENNEKMITTITKKQLENQEENKEILGKILNNDAFEKRQQTTLLSVIIKSIDEHNHNEIKLLQGMKERENDQWNKEKESLGEIKRSIKNVQIYCQKEVHDNLVTIKKFLDHFQEEESKKIEAIPNKLCPVLESIREKTSTNTQLLEILGENQILAFNKTEKYMNSKWDSNQNLIKKISEEHLNEVKNIFKTINFQLEIITNDTSRFGKEMQNLKLSMKLYKEDILKEINKFPKAISEFQLENITTLLKQEERNKLKFQNERFIEIENNIKESTMATKKIDENIDSLVNPINMITVIDTNIQNIIKWSENEDLPKEKWNSSLDNTLTTFKISQDKTLELSMLIPELKNTIISDVQIIQKLITDNAENTTSLIEILPNISLSTKQISIMTIETQNLSLEIKKKILSIIETITTKNDFKVLQFLIEFELSESQVLIEQFQIIILPSFISTF
jgi:hypothetical protein